MLRDDAIRTGLIVPTEEDINRMGLDSSSLPKHSEQNELDKVLDPVTVRRDELNKISYQILMRTARAFEIEVSASTRKDDLVELIIRSLTEEQFEKFMSQAK